MLTEILRKYPILSFLDRMCSSDYILPSADGKGTVILPKRTGVYIPVLALHHDPQYFPDPDKFDPEHFTEEISRIDQTTRISHLGKVPEYASVRTNA
jgi:cytochrome P450